MLDNLTVSQRLAYWLLLLGLGVSGAFIFITQNTYDTGDSIQHYLYARYAPQHPLNLLDSWAKPLFTLLAMGPAQLGYRGLMFFQCVVVAASAWLSYLVARGLRIPYAGLAILLCYSAPDYFHIQFSGLTEPLFGLVLVGSVALAVYHRSAWSAALVSWLPFVRSEGFILLGIWVTYLAWQRQWRALPLLGLGYVVYSALGAIVLGDPGWVFGRNAYPTISTYGHGGWSTYVVGLLYLLGWVTTVLVVLGGGRMLVRLGHRAAYTNLFFRIELLLVYGCVTIFVAAHTLFWAKGLFGSAGLTRVLTVLTPLLAIVALRGLSWLCALGSSAVVKYRIALAVSILSVAFLFTGLRMELRWQRDFGQPADLALAKRAASWYQQLPGRSGQPVAFEHPAIGLALGVDIFDRQARPVALATGPRTLDSLPIGTMLFWDDWFSPVEGHLPLALLAADPRFEQCWSANKMRDDDDPGGGSCRVVVFKKVR